MIQYIIESILGLVSGLFFGITGTPSIGLILLGLDYFKINDYKTNLGTCLFLYLFPISIGSSWEFYKAGKFDLNLLLLLLTTIIAGSYIGSKFAIEQLSNKSIKYITGYFTLILSILFTY